MKRPGPTSFAADRELADLAKTLSLAAIVKKTGRTPVAILKRGCAARHFDQGTK
jgi:hypothetical protein